MKHHRESHLTVLALAMLIIFFIFTLSTTSASAAQPAEGNLTISSQGVNKLYGLDFGPYMDGQNPDRGSQVSKDQIIERMTIIAPYTTWVRTYGTENGLEYCGPIAHEMGLKTAIGAWLSKDSEVNDRQINELINEAKAGYVDLAIVGSETLLRKDLSEDQLINYIKRVKNEAPGVNVTTADTYYELINHPRVMAECDVIMYNCHPYWEGVSINDAIKAMEENHKDIVDHAGGKQVIVSETGWPSSGDTIAHEVPTPGYASEYLNDSSANTNESAVPSPERASKYLSDFLSWARKNNVKYFYFEAFDETWKATTNENSAGAHWGIWDKDGNMKPGSEAILLGFPVANFTTNVTQGYAPLSVQFTDHSENAAEWSWNFGDGATSNEQNPSHVYSAEGTYTISLKVSNANDDDSQTTTITVHSQSSSDDGSSGGSSDGSSSSSGGDSGGGGGAGGSPEPQSNVEIKELSQTFVTGGKSVKFDFPRNATSIVSLSFDSKKTAGKTTTIVEMLKGKSTLVSGMPSGEVYKSLNIWVGNAGFATPTNIENAVVCFKVDKAWQQNNSIDKSSITLNRFSDKKWEQLPTSLSAEDDKYLYFTAKTQGFSPFAITGETTTISEMQLGTGTKDITQKNENTAENVEQTPEQQNNTSILAKESKSTPGFETICGITGLLAVFLYRRNYKR